MIQYGFSIPWLGAGGRKKAGGHSNFLKLVFRKQSRTEKEMFSRGEKLAQQLLQHQTCSCRWLVFIIRISQMYFFYYYYCYYLPPNLRKDEIPQQYIFVNDFAGKLQKEYPKEVEPLIITKLSLKLAKKVNVQWGESRQTKQRWSGEKVQLASF